ncbi:hypothetical protein [Archangium lansingense]|uniref:Uncharacterized protein n=1 Tax=Archangium lansingense TaxID=2995310 RepID=A0ABT4A4G5_9BACT|nr:hypothetical protein [Archangium lansinium]MCY1076535.1 hypothetical protein [Archangium lansinium]
MLYRSLLQRGPGRPWERGAFLQAHEAKLAGLIESTFGFTRLSNDTLFTSVPDLVPRSANYGLGKAQFMEPPHTARGKPNLADGISALHQTRRLDLAVSHSL